MLRKSNVIKKMLLKTWHKMIDAFLGLLMRGSSIKNKRYVCVNLHMNESKVISLEMKRTCGSMKAEDTLMIIAEKPSAFALNLKEDIVGMVTDGAAIF